MLAVIPTSTYVCQTLPYAGSTLELTAIKTGMKEGDPIDYF